MQAHLSSRGPRGEPPALSHSLCSEKTGNVPKNFPRRPFTSVQGEVNVAFFECFTVFITESFIINRQPSRRSGRQLFFSSWGRV